MTSILDISDEQLIQQVVQGDLQAFDILYTRYVKTVYNRVLYKIPRVDVEDVTQEVFITLIGALPTFRGESQFRTWLKDVLSENAIQRMRKNITMQWQQQKTRQSTSSWKNFWLAINPFKQKWYSQRSRRRLSMAISLLLLIALMLISIPFLNGNGTDQPATGIQNHNVSLVIVFSGLILLAIWISRRKS